MNLVTESINYINDTIDIIPEIQALPKTQRDKLPHYINDAYGIYSCLLLKRNILLLQPKEGLGFTPAELSKQVDVVRKKLSTDVVLLLSELNAYNRKRLVGHKVPFIVPKKQMYLPDLMIDLREHFKNVRMNRREYLTPSAQIVLLYCILHKKYSLFPNDLLNLLPYTRMTLNRAFDELVFLELAEIAFPGRDKLLRFILNGKDLWERALPFLRSPVKKKKFVISDVFNKNDFCLAGISALAEYSMIAEDDLPVYAIERQSYRQLQRDGKINEIPSAGGATANIEIWSYAPEILSNNNVADPLSLFLSLRDNQDERIQGELDSMMEDKVW